MPMGGGIPMPGGGIPPGGIMPGGMSMGGIPAGPCDKMSRSGSDIYHHMLHVRRMFADCLPKVTCWINFIKFHKLCSTHVNSPLSCGAAYC